jgi:hypothetical protein
VQDCRERTQEDLGVGLNGILLVELRGVVGNEVVHLMLLEDAGVGLENAMRRIGQRLADLAEEEDEVSVKPD